MVDRLPAKGQKLSHSQKKITHLWGVLVCFSPRTTSGISETQTCRHKVWTTGSGVENTEHETGHWQIYFEWVIKPQKTRATHHPSALLSVHSFSWEKTDLTESLMSTLVLIVSLNPLINLENTTNITLVSGLSQSLTQSLNLKINPSRMK